MTEQGQSTSTDTSQHEDLINLTTGIVSAYVSNNNLSTTDLPGVIESVYKTLSQVGAPAEREVEQKPAVPIKKSITNPAIICLECGKQQKTLKRHLGTAHDMTPDEYRAKWRLRRDYPMVAPDYAEKRRELAKNIGLGRKTGTTQAASKGKTGRTQAASRGKTARKKAS